MPGPRVSLYRRSSRMAFASWLSPSLPPFPRAGAEDFADPNGMIFGTRPWPRSTCDPSGHGCAHRLGVGQAPPCRPRGRLGRSSRTTPAHGFRGVALALELLLFGVPDSRRAGHARVPPGSHSVRHGGTLRHRGSAVRCEPAVARLRGCPAGSRGAGVWSFIYRDAEHARLRSISDSGIDSGEALGGVDGVGSETLNRRG